MDDEYDNNSEFRELSKAPAGKDYLVSYKKPPKEHQFKPPRWYPLQGETK